MTIVGSNGVVELPPIFERDDSGNWSTTQRFRGLRSALVVKAGEFLGKSRIAQEDGVFHLLEVTFTGLLGINNQPPTPDSQIVTVYDLDYAKQRTSLWSRSDVQEQLNKITDITIRGQFRSDLTNLANGERVVVTVNTSGKPTQVALTEAAVFEALNEYGVNIEVMRHLYSALVAGEGDFEFEAPVVRVQRVAPPNSSIRAQFGGLNRYLTTAAFLARFPQLPTIMAENIASQLNNGFWKIDAPRIKTQDATRVLIEEVFEFTQRYDNWVYGEPLTS